MSDVELEIMADLATDCGQYKAAEVLRDAASKDRPVVDTGTVEEYVEDFLQRLKKRVLDRTVHRSRDWKQRYDKELAGTVLAMIFNLTAGYDSDQQQIELGEELYDELID